MDLVIIILCLRSLIKQEDYQLLCVAAIFMAFIDLSYIIILKLKNKVIC